jgi:hypothetical protein
LLYPPLPVTTILPFQPWGIQTWNSIRDSGRGVETAWTRQNDGRSRIAPRPLGGVYAPAATTSADTIDSSGDVSACKAAGLHAARAGTC